MTVLNGLDRYNLALNAIRYGLPYRLSDASQTHSEMLQKHKLYVSEHGQDLPEVRDWQWALAGQRSEE
jgi:xylulose-5-phosphate/fructose-6-phosphate phosphoketolase